MKLAIIIPDGMADRPSEFDGGVTPLEAAATPEMDALVREGLLGRVITVPDSVPAGSDAANMAVLGVDPTRYKVGRAALEAAGRGIELAPEEIAFRANLVTINWEGFSELEDYSAGGITTDEARPFVEALAERLAPYDAKLHLGVGYRHLLVLRDEARELDGVTATPPHSIQGRASSAYLPSGEGAERLLALMDRANDLLISHPENELRLAAGKRPANGLWLWGQGRKAELPALEGRFGISGAVISAVDLVRGIGRSVGMDVIEVDGATGDLDTNYAGKGEAAAKALSKYDIVLVHVEAPDEASHRGDAGAKREAIESVDREVVSRVRRAAEECARKGEDARVLVLPDHLTPLSTRDHAHGEVPFVLAGTGVEPDSASAVSERAAASSGTMIERGWELLAFALGKKGCDGR